MLRRPCSLMAAALACTWFMVLSGPFSISINLFLVRKDGADLYGDTLPLASSP